MIALLTVLVSGHEQHLRACSSDDPAYFHME